MKNLYMSNDDGTLYKEDDIDEPETHEGYIKLVVPDTFTLTAEQCTGGYGNIGQILLRDGIAVHA